MSSQAEHMSEWHRLYAAALGALIVKGYGPLLAAESATTYADMAVSVLKQRRNHADKPETSPTISPATPGGNESTDKPAGDSVRVVRPPITPAPDEALDEEQRALVKRIDELGWEIDP